jgi:hypothetical protein
MAKHPVKIDGNSLRTQILITIDKSVKTNAALQMEVENLSAYGGDRIQSDMNLVDQ